jgi:hypothetical protein
MEKFMSEEKMKQSEEDKKFISKLLLEFKKDLEKNEGVVSCVYFNLIKEENEGNYTRKGKFKFEKYKHELIFDIVRSLSDNQNELDEDYRKEALGGVEKILLHLKREDVLYACGEEMRYGMHEEQSIHRNTITKKYNFEVHTAKK